MPGTRTPIVLAAGGTGGHMFPAEALARALLERGVRVVLITDRRGHAFGSTLPEVEVHRIRARQIGGGVAAKARAVWELLMGYGQARGLLRALAPSVVVGFGGYPSLPTVHAAGRIGIPVLLHEQNAVAGRANRWLASRATTIATSFPQIDGLPDAARDRTVMTGNPVRAAILAVSSRAYQAPGTGPIRILVIGGSQGAQVFSKVVPAALKRLPATVQRRLEVSQQCRPEDLEDARAAYAGSPIRTQLETFFRDVPERLAAAHLVIGRAGASTVAELAAVGRPSILVPYPYAMDDHQTANAAAFAEAGATWHMPQPVFTPDSLAERLDALISQPMALVSLAEGARAFGRADAADRLAALATAIGGLGGNSGNAGIRREAAE
ncbi:MAG: undecaprenyldiphospho-muramoylpentapeptide beta-N-acetylglucosaminyltransferase [Rhodospirillaceae bacterium]|nr:undecaprenyldiphospho-muramoylpentapeptide beta-N-acetylglucosaminyltransferase [Rhodospirillaceae bacterium]